MPEAGLEVEPDVGPEAVAAAEPDAVLPFLGMRRRIEQIAAELADILEERALVVDDVVPELPRREFLADEDRAADGQRRAEGDDAAGRVIERQAVIHPVLLARIHHRREGDASPASTR